MNEHNDRLMDELEDENERLENELQTAVAVLRNIALNTRDCTDSRTKADSGFRLRVIGCLVEKWLEPASDSLSITETERGAMNEHNDRPMDELEDENERLKAELANALFRVETERTMKEKQVGSATRRLTAANEEAEKTIKHFWSRLENADAAARLLAEDAVRLRKERDHLHDELAELRQMQRGMVEAGELQLAEKERDAALTDLQAWMDAANQRQAEVERLTQDAGFWRKECARALDDRDAAREAARGLWVRHPSRNTMDALDIYRDNPWLKP